MPELQVEINGRRYGGWTSATVTRRLEAAAGSFQLSVSDRENWPIAPGAAARIVLYGFPVLDGYVDRVSPSLTARGHSIEVAGRDRTADLIDSSSLADPGEWLSSDLARIAREIAAPFQVPVVIDGDDPGEPFLTFGVQPGESAFEAIERAARLRGLLVTTDGTGALLITRPSEVPASTALVEPGNLLEVAASLDLSERFGRYVVRGQHTGGELFGDEAVTAPQGEATDPLSRPERTLLVLAEGSITPEQAAERAAWEATFRAARSSRVTARVQGWLQRPGGELWQPNLLVELSAPRLGISGRFLVGAVAWSLSLSGGATTELELAPRGAYVPRATLEEEGDPLQAFLARHGLDAGGGET